MRNTQIKQVFTDGLPVQATKHLRPNTYFWTWSDIPSDLEIILQIIIFAIMELDKIKYWTEISDYDLETAEAMYSTGRWLYVGFMCHQTLEKIFKAYWSSKKVEPAPMSHSLFNIAQSCGLNALFSEEQKDFISEMMPLNVEARYPSYKERISEGLSKERCKEILDRTKELQLWIKDRL